MRRHPRKMQKEDADAFMHGYACALSTIQCGWRESSLVEQAAHEGGFFYEDFVAARVDPYDLRLLRAAGVKRRDGKKHRKERAR